MWPDERIIELVEKEFVPVRVHVQKQAAEFQRLGTRYGAQWTPTTLVLDDEGTERHRVEGFLPTVDLLVQLGLGLAKVAFARGDWSAAEHQFHAVADQYPTSDAAPETIYWAGVSRYKASGNASALADTARRLKDQHADSMWAKKASVWA